MLVLSGHEAEGGKSHFITPVPHASEVVAEPLFSARREPLSSAYIASASCTCLRLLRQEIPSALALALLSAGSNMAARIAMIAMTTNNSIRVKPREIRNPNVEIRKKPEVRIP